MPSGRPIYEPNPAGRAAGHAYDIERLKRRLAPPPNSVNPRIVFGVVYSDADVIDPGSGDWTAATDGQVVVITVDPPFATPPTVAVTLSDEWSGDTSPYNPSPFGGGSVGDVGTSSSSLYASAEGKTFARKFTISGAPYFGVLLSGVGIRYRAGSGASGILRARIYEDVGGAPGPAVTCMALGKIAGYSGSFNEHGYAYFIGGEQTLLDGDYWLAVSIDSADAFSVGYSAASGGTSLIGTDLTAADPFPTGASADAHKFCIAAFLPNTLLAGPLISPVPVPYALTSPDKIGVFFYNPDGSPGSWDFGFIAMGVEGTNDADD